MHKSTDSDQAFGVDVGVSSGEFLSREFRLLDRYELQGEVVQALENTKFHKHLAEKVQNCQKKFRHRRCDQNHDWAKAANSCCLRVCPHCQHKRAKTLAKRTEASITGRQGLRYLVLAERNSRSLVEGIASLWAAWSRLRRSVCWRRKVRGCIAVLEVTYKPRTGWHPHLNVLMEGEFFPFLELNRAWGKATHGNGQTTHIQAANEGTVFELIKYTTEIPELIEYPTALDEFLAAVHGSRLVRSYGTFYGVDFEDEEDPAADESCPDCGSTTFIELGYLDHNQLTFDFEKGVFRVRPSPTPLKHCPILPFEFSRSPYSTAIAVEARARARAYEKTVAATFSRQLAA